jgi:O-acetylhomoserine (thiol)-lyase
MADIDFSTKILHIPYSKPDTHGALRMPVYGNASFEFGNAADMELAFTGRKPAHSYSRITNPTVEHLERTVAGVTGAFSVTALASGMACFSNLLFAAFLPGDTIAASSHLFGNTRSILEKNFGGYGISFLFVDVTDIEAVEAALRQGAKGLIFETISNPQMKVADAYALAALAKKYGALCIADSTVTPFPYFSGKAAGADVELLSSTKFISGGATSVGGMIIDYGSYDWAKLPALEPYKKQYGSAAFTVRLKREVMRNMGACLSPQAAYLQQLGLETLQLRADKACSNALQVASLLEKHPSVAAANYPGLCSSPYKPLIDSQYAGFSGSVVCFLLEDKQAAFRFIDSLKLVRRSTNLSDNKSLAIHPASTIFSEYNQADRLLMGVPEGLVRLSIGIEGAADLLNDINNALETI